MSQLESALEWVKKFGHTEAGWAARVLAEELELRPKCVVFNLGHSSHSAIRVCPRAVDPGQAIDIQLEFDSYVIVVKTAVVVQCQKGSADVRVDHFTGDPTPVITVTGITLRSSQ